MSFLFLLTLLAAQQPDVAPVIDAEILAGIEDRTPVRNADENLFEAQAYTFVLVQAHQLSAAALAKAARRDVRYIHLFEEPGTYRGQVIHLEGQLRMLRRFSAPRLAVKEGVPELYEAWVFDALNYYNPYCVLLTELPPGVQVGERLDYQVTCDAYFFKRYRYKAGDGTRDAPLLIGKTVTVKAVPAAVPESEWSFGKMFLPVFLSFVMVTVGLVVGLTYWFRRGDRRVHEQVRRTVAPNFRPPEGP